MSPPAHRPGAGAVPRRREEDPDLTRSTPKLVVHVTTRGGPFAGVSSDVVRRRATIMLGHLARGAAELSVALVDDPTIAELNRAYRKKDRPTDVLAFPLVEASAPCPASGLLGDVILSIPTARRQARAHRRPLLDELTMLLAHGLLHLCGYDHATDAEERVMTAKTDELTRLVAPARTRARARAGTRARTRTRARPRASGRER